MDSQETKSYEAWKARHRLSTTSGVKEQWEAVQKGRRLYDEAKKARENSCYWYQGTTTEASSSGGNWDKWWNMQEKAWSMWYMPSSSDQFESNVKSPLTTGRVESTLHKFKRVNYRWEAFPSTEEDRGKEKTARVLLDTWFNRSEARSAILTWVKEALIHGTSFLRVTYRQDTRKKRFLMSPSEVANVKREEYEKMLESGKPIYTDWQDVTIYKDITLEPKSLRDIYVDPNARTIHGKNYPARYVVERRVLALDSFRQEFCNDPLAMNVDKVVAGAAYTEADVFFNPPKDIQTGDFVEVLEIEHELDDEYIVIANDLCIKYTSMPNRDKKISYHKLDAIEFPHQLYNIGLPDFLMNIQGMQEVLLNMALDDGTRSMNVKTLMDNRIYGEHTETALRNDSQYVPVDATTLPGQDIRSGVMQLPHQQVGYDIFRLMEVLDRSATLATQIDPTQMALLGNTQTATQGVINKEQTELMLGSLIDNFANTGFISVGKQVWALMQQHYTVAEVKEKTGKDKEEKQEKYKKVRLEGLEIVKDEGAIQVNNIEDYSFFETKPEYIDTNAELDIRIAPDSLEFISKGLEMQKSREAYAQMMPNAADPRDSQMLATMKANGIVPLWDAIKLADWYNETQNLPDLRIEDEAYDANDVAEAEKETKEMLRGKSVYGCPGRSPGHYKYHAKILLGLNNQIAELDKEIQESLAKQPIIDGLPPAPDPASLNLMEQYVEAQRLLAAHLQTDTMPADLFEEEALNGAMPPAPAAPLPPAEAPMSPMGADVPMPQPMSMAETMGQPVNPLQAAV